MVRESASVTELDTAPLVVTGSDRPPRTIPPAGKKARVTTGASHAPEITVGEAAAAAPPDRISEPELFRIRDEHLRRGTPRRPVKRVNGTEKPVHYVPPGKLELQEFEPAKAVKSRVELGLAPSVPGYQPLVYQMGPTVSNVELVSLFWGNFTAAEKSTMRAYLQGLAGFLSGTGAPANQAPTVWQYNTVCARVGASVDATSVPTGTQNDGNLRAKIAALQAAGTLPAYAPERVIIVFSKGITWSGFGTVWCAYHNDVAAGQYYAICPILTGTGCGGSNATAAWQFVTSHEVLEAMTDPVIGQGWIDAAGNEGGDPPNRLAINLPFGAVQRFDDNSQSDYNVFSPFVPPFWVRPFSPWNGYAIPNGLWLTGDVSGEGRTDIVHAVQGTDYAHIWLSRGDAKFDVRTFRPWPGYAIPNGVWLTGDFTGDGRADIFHAVAGSDYAHTWKSRGDGTFDVSTFRPWAGYAIPNGVWLAADVTGDRRTDVVHVVAGGGYVNTWLSNGDGTYRVVSYRPWAGYATPNGLWLAGDFTGDGRADLVHVVNGADYVHVWRSNGDGTYQVSTFRPWAGYAMPNGQWLVGDFDGDGRADIVHAVNGADYVHVWHSNGDGTFRVSTFRPWAGYAIPNGVWLAADFDGDGRTDIVHAVQNTDYVHRWHSNGDGTFQIGTFSPWRGYAIPNGLWLTGDFTGDRRSDIVHAVQSTSYVNVWTSLFFGFTC
jgi:hypothetical protein